MARKCYKTLPDTDLLFEIAKRVVSKYDHFISENLPWKEKIFVVQTLKILEGNIELLQCKEYRNCDKWNLETVPVYIGNQSNVLICH